MSKQHLAATNVKEDGRNEPLEDWQANKIQIRERGEFMLYNEMLSDIHFIVGTGTKMKKIPAHKFMLSIGSSVFYAMFNSSLGSDLDEIEIPDVEPSAFLALLKYLYSDVIEVNSDTALGTLYAAKKYAVAFLEEECVKFLESKLTYENAFMLLNQARFFSASKLEVKCLQTIDLNPEKAFAGSGFTKVDLDTLRIVLCRDTLYIEEIKLFQAVIKWATEECKRKGLLASPENLRTVLGNAVKLIRFPVMTIDEFNEYVVQPKLLSDQEITAILLYITASRKPTIDFICEPRAPISLTPERCEVNLFYQCDYRSLSKSDWREIEGPSCGRVMFKVDYPIFVLGLGLYNSARANYFGNNQRVTIELRKLHGRGLVRGETLGICKRSFNSSLLMQQPIDKIMFSKPIRVHKNTFYTAHAFFKECTRYRNDSFQNHVNVKYSKGKRNVQFTFFHFNENDFDYNKGSNGQIPEIIFEI